ncbi:protein YIPF3-like [Ptychodera flava]|uniref:protein YIPF3-like n=1 Tax=Ptychodera flava TaxID=63121 RepID=UPI00396A8393
MAANAGSWYTDSEQNNKGSAVIELGTLDDDEPSTGDTDEFSQSMNQSQYDEESGQTTGDFISSSAATLVWQAGKQQAQKAFNIYGNIDILRPYFDVEPKEVVHRLIHSFVPQKVTGNPQKVASELYGPLMVVFTLVAVILMGMKSSGHVVREGTLMGTAFGVCFGYWIVASGLIFMLAYVCNTHITMLQVLSLTGYSLTSHCIVLLITTVLHTVESHLLFYTLCLGVSGMAALKMITVYVSRTHGKSQKLIIAGVVVSLHLLFLLYLHFSYHQIAEEVMAPRDRHLIIDPPHIPDRAERNAPNVKKLHIPAPDEVKLHVPAKEVVQKKAIEAAPNVVEAVQDKPKELADNYMDDAGQIEKAEENNPDVGKDVVDREYEQLNPPDENVEHQNENAIG